MLQTVKQHKINTIKIIPLNVTQKVLNQVFLIILIHLFQLQQTAVTANDDTYVAFKNCALFSTCKTEINDVFIDDINHIYIAIRIYNLTEYSENYLDTSKNLWQFKSHEPPVNNVNLAVDSSQSFKYKAVLLGERKDAVNNTNSSVKDTKLVVTVKYLGTFWSSVEMPLINCKVHLELNCIENCILSSAGHSAKSKITDAKLQVAIVALSTKKIKI